MGPEEELADYIAQNYGECKVTPCKCLKTGWKGTLCANWVPVKARNWDELRVVFLELYRNR